MTPDSEKERGRFKTLISEVRQATVSYVVAAVLLAGGGVLFGVADEEVPVWLVGVPLVVAGVLVVTLASVYEKRVARLTGQITGIQEGARGQVESAEASARKNEETIERQAREQVSAAKRRADDLEKTLGETRQALTQATKGQVPLTPEAQGLIGRARALGVDVEGGLAAGARLSSDIQKKALLALVHDFEDLFGNSPLTRAGLADGGSMNLPDMRSLLSQLDAYAEGLGRATL